MKIAMYARVSSEKQAKEGTIESQVEALREYAKANNLTISHECIDDGVTGTTLTRPGLDHLRDLIAEGSIEGILILSPDRLSRTHAHQILLMDEFKKQNIKVIFTNQQFEDNAEGNLMLQIQAAVSEYERAKILDRTRRGRKYAVKNGQMLGSMAPYGYRFMPKGEGKPARWEIEPSETEIVRLIFDLYVNKRMKGTQIASYLESEGIQTRSGTTKWWCSVVYRILKSEAYIGNAYMYKNSYVEPLKTPKSKKYRKVKNSAQKPRPREEWIGIPVTPSIDERLWNAAQVLLKKNAHSARRHNNKNEYLLRGLVVCGLCGCMAPGYVSNKSTFYSCGARRNKNIHSKPHDELIQVHHNPFDAKIWQGLTELLQDPENIKAQLEKRLERKSAARLPIANTDTKTDKDLEKLDVQEKRILDAYREGIIDLDELKSQKGKIAVKRKMLEAKKKAAPSHTESTGQAEITLDMLGDVSARFQRAMTKADFPKREKLVNLLVNSVVLYSHKAVVKGNIPVIRGDALNPSNLASGFFYISNRIHARPPAANANRWLASLQIWRREVKKYLVLILFLVLSSGCQTSPETIEPSPVTMPIATIASTTTSEPSPTATAKVMTLQEKVDAFANGSIEFPTNLSAEEYSDFIDGMNDLVGRKPIYVETTKAGAKVVLYFDVTKNKMVDLPGTYAENKAIIDQNALEMFVKISEEPGTGNIQFINSKGELITSPGSADTNFNLRIDGSNYKDGLVDLPTVIGDPTPGAFFDYAFASGGVMDKTLVPIILMDNTPSVVVRNQGGWTEYYTLNVMSINTTKETGKKNYGIRFMAGGSPDIYFGKEGGTLDGHPSKNLILEDSDDIKQFKAGSVYYVGIPKNQQVMWDQSLFSDIDALEGANGESDSFENATENNVPKKGNIIITAAYFIEKK